MVWSMWTLKPPCDEYKSRQEWYAKKRPKELASALDNFDTLLACLTTAGLKLEQVRTLGFVHPEPHGVLAVHQKGGKKGTRHAETRLYVYPDPKQKVIYSITIGD